MSAEIWTEPTRDNSLDDERSASVYRAIALRFYARYLDARRHAEFRGGDIPHAEHMCSMRQASDRYKEAAEGALWEPVETADAAKALVEFAAVIAADKLLTEATSDSFGIDDEVDAMHQVVALAAAARWLNDATIEEYLEKKSGQPQPRTKPVLQ